jgi:2-hydroxychromene-2-carboxylate isomerase
VTPVAVVAEFAKAQGIEGLEQGLELPGTKAKLRDVTDQAIAGGIFGSPFFIVDGEAFWGHDRLAQVDRWLATGGW